MVETWEEGLAQATGTINLELVTMLASSAKYEPLKDAEEQLSLMRDGDEKILWRGLAEIALAGYLRASQQPAVSVMEQLARTLADKQFDYGNDNILWAEQRGLRGLVVRAHDKVARIENLVRRGCAPRTESLLDSWFDLAGYAFLGMMVDAGTFTKPLTIDKENLR